MGGEKRVLRVNVKAFVAENRVLVDLWMHHRRHKEKRDGDPTFEIWKLVKKDRRNLRRFSGHDERVRWRWTLSFDSANIRERPETVLQKSLSPPWRYQKKHFNSKFGYIGYIT